jgi:Protein of unknown function (DUF3309)
VLTILLIVAVVLALGGFGHTGYRRGWYGGSNQLGAAPRSGGWAGGGLGLILLIIVVVLLLTRQSAVGP